MQKFKVIALDVWGHGYEECSQYDCPGGDRCDGFTVNDAHYTGRTIEVETEHKVYNAGTPYESTDDVCSDAAIIAALVEAEMLTPDCADDGAVEIDGDDDYSLDIERVSDGRPLLQLERVKDGADGQ